MRCAGNCSASGTMGAMKARVGRLRAAARGKTSVVVVTAVALLWGRICGGRVSWNPEYRLYVCAGMRAGFARGGTCVGGVFLTGTAEPRDRLLKHEAVHADQWARHGVTFPFRYLREEMRNPGVKNRFEVAAGLEDGGYVKRGGTVPEPAPKRRPKGRPETDPNANGHRPADD